MHEWMTDNGLTPLVVVDATGEGVDVPEEHIKEGRIVLNIAWSATRNLQMTNEDITFEARFGGVARFVSVPIEATQGIYARESGQGMQFVDEPVLPEAMSLETGEDDESEDGPGNDPNRPKGPNLRIVK
jgi:stringent starvation protein B